MSIEGLKFGYVVAPALSYICDFFQVSHLNQLLVIIFKILEGILQALDYKKLTFLWHRGTLS